MSSKENFNTHMQLTEITQIWLICIIFTLDQITVYDKLTFVFLSCFSTQWSITWENRILQIKQT